MQRQRMIPIAHRGLHGDGVAPNTLRSLESARDAGYAAEFDVVISADGVPFITHDYTFGSENGSRKVVFRSQSAAVSSGTSLSTHEPIPTLSDGLSIVAGRVPIYVDVKPVPRGLTAARSVANAIAGYGGPVAVLSFVSVVVNWFRRNRPAITRGQSAGVWRPGNKVARVLQYPIYCMPFNGLARPNFIAFDLALMPSSALGFWLRSLGADLVIWGVKTCEDASRARGFKANVMFDDIRPELDVDGIS